MKKCPYCGKENEEQATVCVRCSAGFPHEEKTTKTDEPEKVSRRKK